MKTGKTKTSTKHRWGDRPTDDNLALLEQRLGIEPGRIEKLRGESDVFAEIWADYEECCARLQSLEQKCASAAEKLHDYLEMRGELERDVLQYLKESTARRTNGGRTRPGNIA